MEKTWMIGSDPASDLVVPAPASARHCRLRTGPGYGLLEDLGSAEGTFVNGVRIAGEVLVSRADSVTLGRDRPMPWPAEPAGAGPMVLRVGREPDNDLVVDQAVVSGSHARLTWSGVPGEAEIEDLGSSNGTGLNGPDRPVRRARFTAEDTIYLGTVPITGAELLSRVDPTFARILTPGPADVVIGRAPGSDRVVDLPSVSGRHARLSRSAGRVVIEDLGSSNGTFINGRRVDRPTPVEPGDLIGLGTALLRLGPLPAARPSPVARTVAIAAPVPGPTARPGARADAGTPAPEIAPHLGLAGLLISAPVAALLILGLSGGGARVPLTLSMLSLAAIGLGLADAAVLGRGAAARSPARLGLLGLACLAQSAMAWGVVAAGAGLPGAWAGSIAFLSMASLVGAALGLLIAAAWPGGRANWAALPALLAASWLLGAGPGSPLRGGPGAIAAASPSRWAFEGLLLLDPARSGPPGAEGPTADPARDPAEEYFPAETDRMGPRADALALGAMLVGYSALAAYLIRSGAAGPSPRTAT